jgi:hypothetical protein
MPDLPPPLEVQRRAAQAIGRSTYSWTPSPVADASDAPQRGDREIFELSIFSASFIRPLSWNDLLGVDLGRSLSLQLKCTHLFPAKAPLPEEAIFNQNQAAVRRGALRARRSTRNARSPSATATIIVPRGERRGSWASPLMRTRRPSRCGVAMLPVWRSTGATCRGHPHHRHPAAPKWHRHAGRGRRGATRLWARAHVWRLPPPEWTSGRSAPVQRPAERALPSCRDLRLVKSIPREGRRSDRRPPANSTTARTAPTLTPCRGTGRGEDRWTRGRRQACRKWRSQVPPRGACSHCSSGVAEPRTFICPSL